MKIYISADIEGVTGINHWDEANKNKSDYREFQEQMTLEVQAACETALDCGAQEVVIKDAHASGRNLILSKLPKNVKIIRGWSGHPFSMMQEIDKSFWASMFIGYHSRAGSKTNPLCHTYGDAVEIRINGRPVSEFIINSYISHYVGVPVTFLAGDEGVVTEAKEFFKGVQTVCTGVGIGKSTISIHPSLALEKIREGVSKAMAMTRNINIDLPEQFNLEVEYGKAYQAYKASFYPKVEQINSRTISLKSDNYFEIIQSLYFIL